MNKGGIQNRAGEIMKELDTLLEKVAPLRRKQAQSKREFEFAKSTMEDLQAIIYYEISNDPDINMENPDPIIDTDGNPMAEFEAQYRSMAINYHIQQDQRFAEQLEKQQAAHEAYYDSETEVVTIMERIGVLKTELATLAALARLASDGS